MTPISGRAALVRRHELRRYGRGFGAHCVVAMSELCVERCGSSKQYVTSTYTVLPVTVVTTSLPAPGAPESVREYVWPSRIATTLA
jgi:hypothetical protein